MGLANIFGDKPIPKILDFFRVYSNWDYSLNDVLRETEVSYRALQIIVPRLVKMEILVQTRTEGRAKMYKFNTESLLAQRIQNIAIEADIEYGKSLKFRQPLRA